MTLPAFALYKPIVLIYDFNFLTPRLNIFSGEVNLKSKGSTIIDFTLNPYKTLRQGDGI